MDAYRMLGLAPGATMDDVRLAYHRLAVQHHPDQRPASERGEAELAMARINEARAQVLRDIRLRSGARPTARAATHVVVPRQRTAADPAVTPAVQRGTAAYVATDRLIAAAVPVAAVRPDGRWRDAVVPGLLALAVAAGLALGMPIPAVLTLLGLLVVASVLALF
jgi:hypothetical protein